MSLGREFQREGQRERRLCRPMSGARSHEGWRGDRHGAAGWSVVVEQVGKVAGGLTMEGFVSEEKDFVADPLCDGEPVKVLENGSDVITGAGVGEQQSAACTGVYLGFLDDVP